MNVGRWLMRAGGGAVMGALTPPTLRHTDHQAESSASAAAGNCFWERFGNSGDTERKNFRLKKEEMEVCHTGFYTEDFSTQEVPADFDFASYDSKAFGQQQCGVDSSYPEPPKAPNLYDTKVGATDAGLLNLDSHQDFNWWTSYPHDGLTVDQSLTGYQESLQTYQNLVPQAGQFSPAVESSHSPFLTGKGSNTLQSKISSQLVKPTPPTASGFPLNSVFFQIKPIRVSTTQTITDRLHPSGKNIHLPASPPLLLTLVLHHPAPQIPPLSLQSTTAPV
ncbi:hypothetical protein ATANTOWER_031077 [Ataeniobius toweri]|uniref:Uncharacterized protein n=1 Tax=Ataeniobius toweri TaxID=208326 RepID=A0ABU7BVQ4_9TELE|nr:hypothetical protein [Ataeniobius toweri]